MGQQDIEAFLNEQRKIGKEWYDVKQIIAGLQSKGVSNGAIKGVYADLQKLVLYDRIDFKGVGVWSHKKVFRAKPE
jgi:hypothetical protein